MPLVAFRRRPDRGYADRHAFVSGPDPCLIRINTVTLSVAIYTKCNLSTVPLQSGLPIGLRTALP
jgi:hypothetical protein